MNTPIDLRVDARSPIPIRRQLTEQLKHVIERGGVPRDQALPSIRELAGFLGINPNTVARAIEDLQRGGYVETRRGKGVFVVAGPPAGSALRLREGFLRGVVIRAAALGMTPDDVGVGVLSLTGIHPVVVRADATVLLVECSPEELEFFARELEAHLPVRVDKVLLGDLAAAARRAPRPGHWSAVVTSFSHLPEVERLLSGRGVPVVALLPGAHLETLHRLAQLAPNARVGVACTAAETAHNLEHSIAGAHLPNIALAGACPAEGAALARLLRRVDVVVCSTAAAERVQELAGPRVQVLIDDRVLDPRAIEALAALLVRQNGDRPPAAGVRPGPRSRRRRPRATAAGGVMQAGAIGNAQLDGTSSGRGSTFVTRGDR